MPGYVFERQGLVTGAELASDVITRMLANGFTLVDQTSGEPSFNSATVGDNYTVILEAGNNVDPLHTTQPWRVCFDVQGPQQVLLHAGTPTTLFDVQKLPVTKELLVGDPSEGAGWQPTDIVGTTGAKLTITQFLPDDAPADANTWTPETITDAQKDSKSPVTRAGYVSGETLKADGTYSPSGIVPAYKLVGTPNPQWFPGSLGYTYLLDDGNIHWEINESGAIDGDVTENNSNDDVTKCFINRTKRIGTSNSEAFPMSYRLVITPRGFWLGVWEESTTAEGSKYFNWVLIQRPVDRETGATIVDGKAPVFCVNAVGNKFWKFVVRESDIFRPSSRVQADLDTEDSEAILNSMNQVALSEDGKYIITFPSRLNTSRYRYPHELDIIASTSADVVSQNTDVDITVYGESTPRKYKALHANGPANTGMRIMVLSLGGGISGS